MLSLSKANVNYFAHCNFVPIRGLYGFSSVRFGTWLVTPAVARF